MGLIGYDGRDAAAFAATRHLGEESADGWRRAVERFALPRAGQRVLDLGAGTGAWAKAFTGWFPGVEVVAVDPSAAMRERSVFQPVLDGSATRIPLPGANVDVVWMSTVIHHVADLAAAGREVRRVLRPGGTVLIRSVFAGRPDGVSLFRWFPEAVTVLNDRYPSVAGVEAAFSGFARVGLTPVPQLTAASPAAAAETLRREAHTPLQLISDDAYAAGVARLRSAPPEPVIDSLDLLVLHASS